MQQARRPPQVWYYLQKEHFDLLSCLLHFYLFKCLLQKHPQPQTNWIWPIKGRVSRFPLNLRLLQTKWARSGCRPWGLFSLPSNQVSCPLRLAARLPFQPRENQINHPFPLTFGKAILQDTLRSHCKDLMRQLWAFETWCCKDKAA
jgi:hypothetical protein